VKVSTNNKQGAGWADLQTVTHFKNAIRGEMPKWYNALPLLDIDNLNWDILRNQFEKDYRAAPTISSVIQKLSEIEQRDIELVHKSVS
jgi:hypothetical protein